MDLISEHPRQIEIWDDDGVNLTLTEIPDRRVMIVPDCCEAIRFGHIRLGLSSDDLWDNNWDAKPIWRITTPAHDVRPPTEFVDYYKRVSMLRVVCCPFCRADLPAIQKREVLPEGPIHVPEGDGDYCETCKERSRGCMCWNPLIRWETVR